jgi:hypothetical protein
MTCLKALLFLFFITATVNAQNLQVANLQCENLKDPLGIDALHPALSWQITSSGNNVMQSAYRLLVSDNQDALQKNTGNIWDSKKVMSGKSIQVIYKGPALQAAKTYYWKVMVWDNQQHTSLWSNPGVWQMGLLKPADWKHAKWIAYEKMPDSLRLLPDSSESKRAARTDVLPLLRKEFVVEKTLKKATVFIAGLGHFELNVNGEKIGDHFLDAGWTNYSVQALYVTFDITNQLKQGSNAMGVLLGNGFYFLPGGRYLKLQLAYGYPKMICRILLEYADGTNADVTSDQHWKTAPGPVTFSSIYGGEDYNANLLQDGWNAPGFNDKLWQQALVVDGPPQLDAQTAQPLKIFDNFTVKKITQPGPGLYVYDLGQNASGIPQISVRGKKGDTVSLWPSELLDSNGLVTTAPIGSPVYFKYTLKGDGTETWQPRFMYYGFRYVQVQGAVPGGESNPGNLPVIVSVKGLHTRNAAERVGEFSCSKELFNKTDTLIDWAIKSNMASVFTDCPHREKLGWLEEAHLVGPSIRYNFDIAALCRKIVRDMMHAQTSSGLVPDIAPEYAVFWEGFRDSPEWGSNCVIMPWYVFEWYGDKKLLEQAYPMMQRYVAYLQKKAKNGLLSYGLGDWYDIGPKEPGPSQLTSRGITATAIYYYDLQLMIKAATLLGRAADAGRYKATAARVRASYNKTFFNAKTRHYDTGSQTANAMSVYMGLVEAKYKNAVVDNIVQQLRNRNNSLSAGDIGYRYLLRVLEDNGRSDVIYDMNSNAEVPGYGYQLAKGATALTESWQAYTNASNNHMMLGHLKEWFFSGLAGIRPAKNAVAWKKIEIRPQPAGDVRAAAASFHSPYGLIASSWNKAVDHFELNVEIPVNTTAVIYLPAAANMYIKENGETIPNNKIHIEKGYSLISVGSGKYRFELPLHF